MSMKWIGGWWTCSVLILHCFDDGVSLDEIPGIHIASVILLADDNEAGEKELLKWAKPEKWHRLVVADDDITNMFKQFCNIPIKTVLIRQEKTFYGEWENDIGVKIALIHIQNSRRNITVKE